PMLLEKYMQAAEKIVAAAVPRVPRVSVEHPLLGPGARGRANDKLPFYEPAKLSRTFTAQHTGSYRLALLLEILGQFVFDPGRCRVILKVDEHEVWHDEFG